MSVERAEDGSGAPPGEPGGRAMSIRVFLTDGSLAAVCEELGRATGVRVRLRDERGLVLPAWSRSDHPGVDEPPVPGSASIPLTVDSDRIGELTIEPEPGASVREGVRETVELLAHVAGELCADVVELRNRVTEVRVLSRLSAMLADGGKEADALGLALDSALEALRLDAGSIMLLPEDADGLSATENEADLRRSSARALSERWLDNPIPLSRGRVFDRLSLAGEVVISEDLAHDDRVMLPERCVEEELGSFIGAGLVFGGRPLGVIRLYARDARAFTSADRRLVRSIGQQAAAAVEQARLIKVRARERRVQRALKIAGSIQQRMLARQTPSLGPVEVAARFVPTHELGGDFYDLFEMRGRVGVTVGDVVGKGVPAAVLMSAVRATLRAHADQHDDLGEVMRLVNHSMCRDTASQEFATVWFGVIDPSSLELEYVSAGHDPPLLVRRGDDGAWRARRLQAEGLVVGVMAGEAYGVERTPLRPGDALVVYTDGLIDAQNFDRKRFGRERFERECEAALGENPDASAEMLVDRLLWGVRRWIGLTPQADDETVAVVRIRG